MTPFPAYRPVTELPLPALLAVALQRADARPEQAAGKGLTLGAVGTAPARLATGEARIH